MYKQKICKEEGCRGILNPMRAIPLKTGCYHITPLPYCGVCGAVYYPDGGRVYQAGFDNKLFSIDSKIILKPTEDEEVRPLKVDEMISLYDSSKNQEELLPKTLEYFEKTSKLGHLSNCELDAEFPCTCGFRKVGDFLKEHKT